MSVGNVILRVYTSAISLPRSTTLPSVDYCNEMPHLR
jgi:hypothetical protein